jgi:DNA-binding NarL/FixJ family response regulator
MARPARRPKRADLLARREADVARLVADGLTNEQIGARLFISERTVDSYVRSILTKLGFSSRAQVAAWMARED